ncbi:Glucose-6-phosphate isomerase [subsurface metagenome]
MDVDQVYNFVSKEDIHSLKIAAEDANKALHEKTRAGKEFLGWVDLPTSISEEYLSDIEKLASQFHAEVECVVVIGIGGSYLGAKAVAEALSDTFAHLKKNNENPTILFAGQNIGQDYLGELLELLNTKSYGIVVISKSGTTTEPAIAFRLLKEHLENKVGKEKTKNLIVAVTDKEKGALRALADQKAYKSFAIPDDVGGRYSVLTPVGLVPLA